jgi:hypothetical protein
VTVGIAKKEGWFAKAGSKWQTIPEQMLRYRAATFLIRTIAPEIGLGLHTVDELEDAGPSVDKRRMPSVVQLSNLNEWQPLPVIEAEAAEVLES